MNDICAFTHLCTFSLAAHERCRRDQLNCVSQRRFRRDSRQYRQGIVSHFTVFFLAPDLQDFFEIFLLIGCRWHDYHTIEKINRNTVRTFVIGASNSCDTYNDRGG